MSFLCALRILTWLVDYYKKILGPLVLYTCITDIWHSDRKQNSAISRVTRLRAGRPRNRGSIPDRDKILFLQSDHGDCGPPSLLLDEYRDIGGKSRSVKDWHFYLKMAAAGSS